MDVSHQVLNNEFNIIDNIIESAVDELLQKQVTTHNDYVEIDALLLPLCRLCAREEMDMEHLMDISEEHFSLINELHIFIDVDGTSVCSKICSQCNAFLEEIRRFRVMCDEAQKRIADLLTQRSMLPDFLKLDFSEPKEPYLPLLLESSPLSAANLPDDGMSIEPTALMLEEHLADVEETNLAETNEADEPEPQNVQCTVRKEPAVLPGKRILAKRAATKVSQLVKSLQSVESDESTDVSDAEEYKPAATGGQVSKLKKRVTKQRKPKVAMPKLSNKQTDVQPKRFDSRRQIVNGRLTWVCLDCEQVFESCRKLKIHRRTCPLVGSEQSKRVGMFPCDVCGYVNSTLVGLRIHLYKHRERAPQSKRKHTVSKEKICHVCGKTCQTSRALRQHLVCHSQEKKNECHICGQRFRRMQVLKIHVDTHSENRQHECDVCGKKFYTKAVLYNHRKIHDESYRRRQCLVCSKRFAHPYQLREHMMIHTGEYPFLCSICGAKYRTLGKLKRHQEVEHVQIFDHATVVEADAPSDETDSNEVEDIIVYQPEDDLAAMLDTIPQEMPPLTPPATTIDALDQESVFPADHLLDHPNSEFAVPCFPHTHEADDGFYSFMEC
ncbi:zinc finger protein weckle-like isoform X2 [Anopheles cruzii]|uniref:zinc finger protein weckle-like isoform X2 n=1 Tax=Anopheles cruzii TaxID=68878 RepID=UPI0022EC322B|nr:zinc finger protein weckle-like isoform X2 [Anopheles cruzii]